MFSVTAKLPLPLPLSQELSLNNRADFHLPWKSSILFGSRFCSYSHNPEILLGKKLQQNQKHPSQEFGLLHRAKSHNDDEQRRGNYFLELEKKLHTSSVGKIPANWLLRSVPLLPAPDYSASEWYRYVANIESNPETRASLSGT